MDKYLNKTGLQRLWVKIKAYIDGKDVHTQTQGNWRYRVYPDGTYEAWYGATKQTVTITSQSGNVYRSDRLSLTLPAGLTLKGTTTIESLSVYVGHNNYPTWPAVASKTGTQVNYYVLSGGSRAENTNYTIVAYVFGTIS